VIKYICDLCGKSLKGKEVIYELNIEVHAIYQPLQVDLVDLLKDHTDEIRRLIEELKDKDPQELQDQIYKTFKFHLCPSCQQRYIKNPMPSPTEERDAGAEGDSTNLE
jgi:hypothetical protein